MHPRHLYTVHVRRTLSHVRCTVVNVRDAAVTPPTKDRLTREALAQAALTLADAEGLKTVSIRRLATQLGVTPMALYWHYEDKEALLDGVAEAVLTEVDLAALDSGTGEPWEERLRALLEVLVAALAAHPAAAGLIKNRMLLNDPGRQITERLLASLRGAGFSAEQASRFAVSAILYITNLITGMPGLAIGTSEEQREQQVRERWAALQALPPKQFPHIIESAVWLTDCVATDQWLGLGLDTLIAGIRAQAPRP